MPARLVRFFLRPRDLGIVTACVLATAMVVAAVSRVWDPDVWWVAAAGREMLARGIVPRQNLFSYVEPGHPWVMHEWLFGPPYAAALARFGPPVLDVIAASIMACELGLLCAGTVGRARHASVGIGAMLVAVAFFGGRFLSARPTGVALLFPIALALVAFAARFSVRSLLAAAAIEIVWANAHGSFPLGVVLLLVASIDHPVCVRSPSGRADDQARDRALRLSAAAVAAAATFATPYGFALHRFVWGYFLGTEGVYRSIHLTIREFGTFRSAWGSTVGPVDLAGFVVLAVLAAGAARHARHRVRALLCLALLGFAAAHVRHVELAGLLSCLLLVPYADEIADRFAPVPPAFRRRLTAALLLGPACIAAVVAHGIVRRRRTAEEWIAAGPSFLRSLARVPDHADLVVPFTSAGLAIWYAFPRGVRVTFDSRNDCYSAATLASFWSLEAPSTPPEQRREALDRGGADAALLPRGDPLAAFLASEPGWRLARVDGDWRVFLRGTAHGHAGNTPIGSSVACPGAPSCPY